MSRRKPSNKQKNSYSKTKNDSNPANKTGTSNSQEPDAKQSGNTEPPKEATQNNDPAWYSRDPALLRDAATILFSYPFGKRYYLNGAPQFLTSSSHSQGKVDLPGLCVLRLKPTLGFSNKPTSPLNVSANSIYAYVRHLNAGRKNYDPADLMIYITAIANVYSAIVWAERLYSFATAFSDSNRYIGDSLLVAEGLDPYKFRLHLADYRMRLNAFISKMCVFAVPADITYFNKLTFMYRDVFLENGEGNIKDQMYMYVPDGFYKFALDGDNLGCLDYTFWDYGPHNTVPAEWTDVIDLLESLGSGIFGDEDASLISGDLFKVYGDRIIRLTSMEEILPFPLVYDPMVLWQMKNACVTRVMRGSITETNIISPGSRLNRGNSQYGLGTGRTQSGMPGCVFQKSDGTLMSVERLLDQNNSSSGTYTVNGLDQYRLALDKILSSDLPQPTAGEVMESSRLMVGPHPAPVGYSGTETNPNFGWVDCGTFLVVNAYTGVMQGGTIAYFAQNTTAFQVTISGGFKTTIGYGLADIFMYKYFPICYAYWLNSSSIVQEYYVISDIANYAILDAASIDKLHEAAILSLLYVPGIARIG